jgi:hypothetical protein
MVEEEIEFDSKVFGSRSNLRHVCKAKGTVVVLKDSGVSNGIKLRLQTHGLCHFLVNLANWEQLSHAMAKSICFGFHGAEGNCRL